ncbi:MAG: LacI family DNA-binding transcriptional regulator [Verrucomicrobiota bacterium]
MNSANEDVPGKGTTGSAGAKSEGKSITMAMIAKAAGVSQGAISSLLNDRDYGIRVSPKTRERVFRVCREMGYIPNDLRAVVRMYPEMGEFALLVADNLGLGDPLVDRLIKSFVPIAPGQHLSVALYKPESNYAADPEKLPEPVRLGVASKFITIGTPNLSLLSAVTLRECPAVHVGYDVAQPGVTSIVPEYAAASRQGVEYLFHQGHRQIAILSGPFGSTDPAVVELNHGVRAGYDSIRIPIEAQNVIYGEASFEHGVASVDFLLDRGSKPTAVFCFSDLVAAGVLHRAQERGLHIPRDLSVMGCGDAAFSPWLHPPLTTVGISAEEIVRYTLAEIHTRITQEDSSSIRKFSVTGQVIERGSCAKPTA